MLSQDSPTQSVRLHSAAKCTGPGRRACDFWFVSEAATVLGRGNMHRYDGFSRCVHYIQLVRFTQNQHHHPQQGLLCPLRDWAKIYMIDWGFLHWLIYIHVQGLG